MTTGHNTPQENPLVPHRLLRRMYSAMVEARRLDKPAKKKAPDSGERPSGWEACLTAILIGVAPGDLVLDAFQSPAVPHLLGVDAGIAHDASTQAGPPAGDRKRASSGSSAKSATPAHPSASLLPHADDGAVRLVMASGAASALKASGLRSAVVVYLHHREVDRSVWREMLGLASREALPLIFFILPEEPKRHKEKKNGHSGAREKQIRELARENGIPAIPVDAADSIALYRVAQESLGRVRAGDGPVILQTLHYEVEGSSHKAVADPIELLGAQLLARHVCDRAWLEGVSGSSRSRRPARS